MLKFLQFYLCMQLLFGMELWSSLLCQAVTEKRTQIREKFQYVYNVFFLCCCVRDAIVINFVSFGTSLYAGIAVFSIIGFMAHEQRVPIEKVINSGWYLVKVVVRMNAVLSSFTKIVVLLVTYKILSCVMFLDCGALCIK